MKLIHDTQLIDIHTWDRQERADWLYDYLTTRNEAYWYYAHQQRRQYIGERLIAMALYVADWRVSRYMALVMLAGHVEAFELGEVA